MPKNFGFLVPRPSKCTECKGGTKGMDVCETCAGTGTVFKVGTKTWPDTREGYDQAERALNGSLSAPASQDDTFTFLKRQKLEHDLADYL
jgi:DnaJ-class molecular chaperone